MQSIAPLSISDILTQFAMSLLKIEIMVGQFSPFDEWDTYGSKKYNEGIYGGSWINIASLSGINGDVIQELSMSLTGAKLSFEPMAAKWNLRLANPDALFHPQNDESSYKHIIALGRKVKLYTGIKVGGIDYYWQRLIGIMGRPSFDGSMHDIYISGFDYMQVLSDTKMKKPDNYWGTSTTISTVAGQYDYVLPVDCKGAYYAVWDSTPIYNGNDWIYDRTTRTFSFNPDKTILDGVDNLIVYYFTQQIPEEIVADILVIAGLYVDRAAALAAMDYTATGLTIDRVWFGSGNSALNSIQKLCERCNYRFFMEHDGTPNFNPAPSEKLSGQEDIQITHNQHSNYRYYEDDAEVFNRIVIEGEEEAAPIWIENSMPNQLRGTASDNDEIKRIGEKTFSITNHLFQDQATIDNMCATLLAERKTVKKYFTFDLEFNPVPLEYGDTTRLQERLVAGTGVSKHYGEDYYNGGVYGGDGKVIVHRGIIRDIKINNHTNSFICEEVT